MNFKQESFITNFLNFVRQLSDQEVVDLHQFMLENYDGTIPTDLQKEFIDEFIGFKEWGEYIMHVRTMKANPNHMWRPMQIIENVTNLRNFLGHETGMRYRKFLEKSHNQVKTKEKREESFRAKLKKELNNAVENSYFDGVFDKCDGWCNVADVLEAAGLISLSDD